LLFLAMPAIYMVMQLFIGFAHERTFLAQNKHSTE